MAAPRRLARAQTVIGMPGSITITILHQHIEWLEINRQVIFMGPDYPQGHIRCLSPGRKDKHCGRNGETQHGMLPYRSFCQTHGRNFHVKLRGPA